MNCPNCGFVNVSGARYCRKCGHPLNNMMDNGFNGQPQYYPKQANDNKNVVIICITLIVIVAIVMGTFFFLSNNNEKTVIAGEGQSIENNITHLNVSQVSFYLDGNPNTGIPATINVGKEHSGESMGVVTVYSRDGSKLNNPSSYENHVVDDDGNIVITEYAPIPKYPDYCSIEIRYNNQVFKYGCDMGKYKGSQTSIPKVIE